MTIGEMISCEAPRLLGRLLTEQTSLEGKELLLVARDALLFISELGQDYRFEDFRRAFAEGTSSIAPLLTEAVGRLKRLQGELHSPEEQELASVFIDACDFIASTGQLPAFEAFRREALTARPPHVFASFRTREEAQAWLDNQPEPLAQGQVLVAGDYYQFYYFRELNRRGLRPQFTLEMLIRQLMEEGPPGPVASFASHEEAEAWLAGQRTPPTHAFVRIDGELHLAVFHEGIHHRALHPVSIVGRLEKWEREQGLRSGPDHE